jgi:hypothetical protein
MLALSVFMFAVVFVQTSHGRFTKNLVCAKSYSDLNRSIEITQCQTLSSEIAVNFRCSVIYAQKISKDNHDRVFDSIEVYIAFSGINGFQLPIEELANTSEISLEWFKLSHGKTGSRLGNGTVLLQKTANKSLDTRLVLYDIYFDTMYRICANYSPPSLNFTLSSKDFCCQVEQVEVKEPSNVYMAIIVISILGFIYLVVIVVHWRCPPSSFNSIDEILGTLPSAHVEKLKKMISDREETMSSGDTASQDTELRGGVVAQSDQLKYTRQRNSRRPGRRASAMDYDNKAYDTGDESLNAQSDTYSGAGRTKQTMVKFADENSAIDNFDELGRLKLKVLKEAKRRASVAAFKKTYALNVSSEDEESDS